MKMKLLAGLVLAAALRITSAQTPGPSSGQMPKSAHPTFDIVTIKPSDPDSHRQGIGYHGRQVDATGQTLKSLMMFAYGVHGKQIVDEPAWVSSVKFNIVGVADIPGEPSLPQMQEMYRKLFTDRFGLQLRHGKRELSYYAITIAKGGTKVLKAKDGDDASPDQTGEGHGYMEMRFTANLMSDFALGMNYFADRPIVDETGLQGRYDFTLKWTPDTATPTESSPVPGLFTAMQEQLGLKLEPKKGMVDVLAIEKVQQPSAN
ncbi:TIGR03435 family protein [Granulicella tundricola]|uniref:Soil-associated protein, TIGR03435 family n=1 Tax=Granulicella tundricola (strain ATCC BAA-1859 / DSM 23138 / MP5ACTX9) TaxID=1198114 RepID=E8X344_GRATM|nr:TIGR03435 family protein [Granulicella tundricola]ADW69268.1 hypothetical protein AciX9_2226 [Granulicella tundricola MP5ACTX9]